MFQQLVSQLRSRNWTNKDGLQSFVDELTTLLEATSTNPIQITKPLKIENYSGQPAIDIVNVGGDARAINFRTADGVETSFGAGLGNRGLVANEFVPVPIYFLPPESILRMGTQGAKTGLVDDVPTGELDSQFPQNTGPYSGTGPLPEGMPPEEVGNGELGHGYWSYPGRIGPSLGQQVGTGGGAGSGGTYPGEDENQTGGGGGGWDQALGNTWRSGNRGRYNDVPLVPNTGGGLGGVMFSGKTVDQTVVTDVTFDDVTCELTKTTKVLKFVNGLLQDVT